MGEQMPWTQTLHHDPVREVAELIDDVVTAIRNRGYTRERAMKQAALELGMTHRRVRSLTWGEAWRVTAEEHAAIRARFLDFLDREAEQLAARSEAARARRRQMELDI